MPDTRGISSSSRLFLFVSSGVFSESQIDCGSFHSEGMASSQLLRFAETFGSHAGAEFSVCPDMTAMLKGSFTRQEGASALCFEIAGLNLWLPGFWSNTAGNLGLVVPSSMETPTQLGSSQPGQYLKCADILRSYPSMYLCT
jgi:hypothetical protein